MNAATWVTTSINGRTYEVTVSPSGNWVRVCTRTNKGARRMWAGFIDQAPRTGKTCQALAQVMFPKAA